MNNIYSARVNILFVIILAILLIFVILFSNPLIITVILSIMLCLIMAKTIFSLINTINTKSIIGELYDSENYRDFSIAPQLLAEILKNSAGPSSIGKIVAGLISQKFRLNKFAVFFRDDHRFSAGIYSNISSKILNNPRSDKIRNLTKSLPNNGKIVNDSRIGKILFKENGFDDFDSPFIFVYYWGRSRAVIVAGEDIEGLLADTIQDPEFNKVFWPALDSIIKQYKKRRALETELKKIKYDYSFSKRDLLTAGKELNKRIVDLNSFVSIFNDFYSILDEGQLFISLKDTILKQLGSKKVEFLFPNGKGQFIEEKNAKNNIAFDNPISLDIESEIFEMLTKKSKPVLLPVAASGLSSDDKFLVNAMREGFQIVSPFNIGSEIGCFVLCGEKENKKQFEESELNFLSVITNIASLSLSNIRQYKTIEKLSYTDSMTGIFNYRYFYKRLGEEILRAKRYNRDLALVILDIDNFKLFNDNYGHQTGDMVLRQISELIAKTSRSIDIVSRYGGEEFCIIMPDTNEENGRVFIERLRSEIADFKFKSKTISDKTGLTVSIGCSIFPHHAGTSDRTIYCADMALLKAKSLGRNKAIMYTPDSFEKEKSPIGRIEDE